MFQIRLSSTSSEVRFVRLAMSVSDLGSSRFGIVHELRARFRAFLSEISLEELEQSPLRGTKFSLALAVLLRK